MAQDSKRVRKYRRQSRELTLTYRAIDILARERDQARMVVKALQTELKKLTLPPKVEPIEVSDAVQEPLPLTMDTPTLTV